MAGVNGVLRINSTPGANTRYFTDETGRPIYLTGAHTWATLQDGWLSNGKGVDPPPAFDYAGYLDDLVEHNENFIRLWMNELPKVDFSTEKVGVYYLAPMPWQRTGPGLANDGKPKFDLTAFDTNYFDRLRSRVMAARDRGVYVCIMLFEGYCVRQKPGALGWNFSPFHASNNINGINGDPDGDGYGSESHSLQVPAITALQKDYLRKVIDTVNDLDNVLYEIANEEGNLLGGTTTRDWQYALMQFIREYEADKSRQHPVMISCIYNQDNKTGNNGWLTGSSADCIAPWGPNNLIDNPSATTGEKVVFADTDHIFGVGGGSDWVWKVFMRGYNAIYMDAWDSGFVASGNYNRDAAHAAMGATRAFAQKINLMAMPPQNKLSSTAYCLANPGVEYLVYQPVAGNITLDGLGAGDYTVEWTHPDTGCRGSTARVTLGGGTQILVPPFVPAVLYLKLVDNSVVVQ